LGSISNNVVWSGKFSIIFALSTADSRVYPRGHVRARAREPSRDRWGKRKGPPQGMCGDRRPQLLGQSLESREETPKVGRHNGSHIPNPWRNCADGGSG
jgi:hypothetical protein